VLDDAIAMLRSADERLQDQELERARQEIGRGIFTLDLGSNRAWAAPAASVKP
jgi:hypothetical protein